MKLVVVSGLITLHPLGLFRIAPATRQTYDVSGRFRSRLGRVARASKFCLVHRLQLLNFCCGWAGLGDWVRSQHSLFLPVLLLHLFLVLWTTLGKTVLCLALYIYCLQVPVSWTRPRGVWSGRWSCSSHCRRPRSSRGCVSCWHCVTGGGRRRSRRATCTCPPALHCATRQSPPWASGSGGKLQTKGGVSVTLVDLQGRFGMKRFCAKNHSSVTPRCGRFLALFAVLQRVASFWKRFKSLQQV